ncbi:MAG: HAMP domain-containing sensor histidine kinase [Candidatus Levybacteria bacterium]|nr:HAMP domain-containing sensor histidine kinase [Candidatus Levybacteria bacterium]
MTIFIALLGLLLITLVFFLILSKAEREKTEFFHVMAHRFRSPISIIKWYLELLSEKSVENLNDKQKKYFTEIYNASEKLNETIDSLSILLQLQANNLIIKKGDVNIKKLIAQVVQKLKLKIERHQLHLQEAYPEEQEIIVQTDPKLLSIVLQNLIENAIRYTPENGNIDIKVNLSSKGTLIEIKDNGYGIPEKKKSRILADSINFKDMGLSLYLVKLILRKMHAHISFKSEKNKGTTFSILLSV